MREACRFCVVWAVNRGKDARRNVLEGNWDIVVCVSESRSFWFQELKLSDTFVRCTTNFLVRLGGNFHEATASLGKTI